MKVEPVTLNGRTVRLVPLSQEHTSQLAAAGADESIWQYMRYGRVKGEEEMRALITRLLAWQDRGTDLPFTVFHRDSGIAIGMTRYLDIQPENRGLEIGGTWYGVEYQRSAVNTECKYLLLQHAFENLDCIRVQFKADERNERSLRAIERIGAVREGLFRDHMILPNGSFRSSVFYSILAREWPAVKQRLIDKLGYNPADQGEK